MRIGQVAAIYSIIIGVAMLVMWAAFLATGRVPELNTALCEIVFHMVAEGATALALIVGGCGLLAGEKWGLQAYMLSMGMLLYTLIMSPGYSL
ncbi:MAG TPA: hypothetical protein VK436_11070, partial [Methanocella sp.]|nr:hypothetical protein [Methanocella sp.]